MVTAPHAAIQNAGNGASELKLSLGRGNPPTLAIVDSDRLPERPCERLIAGLGDVMVILAVERLDMERKPGMLGECLEPLAEQLGIHLADLGAREGHVPHEVGPARNVERDAG